MSYESKPPSIGLWKNDNDRGPHATGNCGLIRFVLWINTDKHSDNSPDYRLVLEAPQIGPQTDAARAPARLAGKIETPGGGSLPDDEIPFGMEWR